MTTKNFQDLKELPYGFHVGFRWYETICYWDRRYNKGSVKDKSKVLLYDIDSNREIGTTLPFKLYHTTHYEEFKTKTEWEQALSKRHGKCSASTSECETAQTSSSQNATPVEPVTSM